MKCDVCRTESEFDAAFIKQRKSFRLSRKTICPACWTKRANARETRFLAVTLAGGICGYILDWIMPGTFLGSLLKDLFLISLFVILAIVPHELGHALVARAVGWRVYQVVFGIGKSLFKQRLFGILVDVRTIPLAGATWMTPIDIRRFRAKRFFSVAAGPAMNAAMAIAVIFFYQGGLSHFDFDGLPNGPRLFVCANACVAILNLWPHQSKAGFALPSDGKQLLECLWFSKKAMDEVRAMRFCLEAMMCREQGDLAGARAWCAKGLESHPEDARLLNLHGITLLDEQNYTHAREVFLKLLSNRATPMKMRPLFLNNLAYADVLSENPNWIAEADSYSRDAFTAAPWMPAIVGTRGTVLVALGQYEEGTRLLRQSMQYAETPRSKAENSCHLSIALARTGRCDEARKYLKLAEQLDAKCLLLGRAEGALRSAEAEVGSCGNAVVAQDC